MKLILSSLIASSFIVLSACAPDGGRDYDSAAACAARGLKPGMPGYEDCARAERQGRMLEEQRREYEERKAEEEYWRNRRGLY
jgi:hypothetical protein